MTFRHGLVTELSCTAEGMAGTAASSALRRVRSLADTAPSGRLFGAISTLSDLSRSAERNLAAGADALRAGKEAHAANALTQALSAMDRLAVVAGPGKTSTQLARKTAG
ncbi:hypothetical protein [Aestuariivirga sp.]|uniref:hypothetical protein n=1 Tax=Aestuariivirga sp. TaxID=2650926 RepID=UPI0039E2324F